MDAQRFRDVLGHYPTGVSVVTAGSATAPCGMSVGSFTSVSLDPPLVAFLPARSSTSWPAIRDCGRFCVNVLAEHQEDICRRFAASGADKFTGVEWECNARGVPVLAGATAWIDCDLQDVHDAGDHYIAVGHVRGLEVATAAPPLVFFRGAYFGLSQRARAATAGRLRRTG